MTEAGVNGAKDVVVSKLYRGMYSFEVDSIVGSVLSPGEACGDLTYIYDGKQCKNEVHTVNWHKTIEVLYCPE